MIVLADAAKPVLLAQQLAYLRGLSVRLYVNDWTPAGSDTSQDYVEAAFTGYAPKPLGCFRDAYLNFARQGEADTCPLVWIQTVASPENTVYGYYVTDANGYLIWAERRVSGPERMASAGAVYSLSIAFLLDTLAVG